MADKPILFSGPMVRAIQEGRKTQTRRVLKIGDAFDSYRPTKNVVDHYGNGRLGMVFEKPEKSDLILPLPYAPNDRLWVRERFAVSGIGWGKKPSEAIGGRVHFHADPDHGWHSHWGSWHPSIHMPRWASRLTLTVTQVRVERLQDISRTDATAEGCLGYVSRDGEDGESPEEEFHSLWESLNAERAPWSTNPWVAAYTFTVARHNIDAAPAAA
jgi:hypothetical protein